MCSFMCSGSLRHLRSWHFETFVAILTLRCMESCHGNFVISHVKLQIITKILHQNYGVICHLWYYRSNVHYLVLLGCVTTLIALSSLGFVTATLITCTLWGELLLPSLYPRVHPTIFSPIYCQRLGHQPDPDHTASHQTLWLWSIWGYRLEEMSDPVWFSFCQWLCSSFYACYARLFCDQSSFYFGGARSKGFATLRNVSKLPFFDKIGQAKSVGFRFYSAIWRGESRISSRYLEITLISLIYSLTFSRKKELLFWLSRGLNRLTCVTCQIRGDSKLRD